MPRFFRDHELPEFAAFLDRGECPYFVITDGGTIVGCGGYGQRPECELADLCWGMVAPDRHGQRLGELLLLGRLRRILSDLTVTGIRLGTSQLTEGFFQKYGFATKKIVADGIDSGLDDVEMLMRLTPEERARIDQLVASEWPESVIDE